MEVAEGREQALWRQVDCGVPRACPRPDTRISNTLARVYSPCSSAYLYQPIDRLFKNVLHGLVVGQRSHGKSQVNPNPTMETSRPTQRRGVAGRPSVEGISRTLLVTTTSSPRHALRGSVSYVRRPAFVLTISRAHGFDRPVVLIHFGLHDKSSLSQSCISWRGASMYALLSSTFSEYST